MKKFISGIIAFMLLFTILSVPVSADKEGSLGDGNITWLLQTSHSIFTLNGTGIMPEVGITDSWRTSRGQAKLLYISEGFTNISKSAFEDFKYVTDAFLPSTITEIDENAFKGCTGLKSITLYDGIEKINADAFNNCSSLKNVYFMGSEEEWNNIEIDESNTSLLNATINFDGFVAEGTCGENAQWTLNAEGELVISGTGEIYEYSMVTSGSQVAAPWTPYMFRIKSVEISDGITKVSDYAFYQAYNIKSIKLGKDVSLVEAYAFSGCTNAEYIYVSDENDVFVSDNGVLMTIDKSTIVKCPQGLKVEKYIMPESVTRIEKEAFRRQNTIKEIVFSSNVNYIEEDAFGNAKFEKIDFNGAIFETEHRAFEYCTHITELEIPEGNTKFGSATFIGCTALEKVTLPDSMTVIAQELFENCASLVDVKFGKNVKEIQAFAFYACYDLKTVDLPDTLVKILDNVFSKSGLETIVLPDSMTKLTSSTFQNCASLKSITFPENITVIPYSYLNSCTALETVVIPEGVTEVQQNAFYNCGADIYVPSTLTKVGSKAFAGDNVYISDLAGWCKIDFVDVQYSSTISNKTNLYVNGKILTDLVVPSGVTKISPYAFSYITSIKTVTIGNNVETVGEHAFEYCTSIEDIILDKSVKFVEDYAFANCSGIKNITLTNSIEEIGDYSFLYVNNTQNIYYSGTQNQWLNTKTGTQNHGLGCNNIHYGSLINPCGNNLSWKFDLESGKLTVSGKGEMYNYTSDTMPWLRYKDDIKTIEISKGVTSIGENAFRGTSVEKLIIGENVANVGQMAFYGCEKLNNIDFKTASDVKLEMGRYVFYGCKKLVSVILPAGMETISNSAFRSCTALKEITMPSSVKTVVEYAFKGCNSLTTVFYVGTEDELRNIKIELNNERLDYANFICVSNVEKCGDSLMCDYSASKGKLTIFGSGDMYDFTSSKPAPWAENADKIVSIEIQEGVTSIGNRAFANVENVTEITIPSTVTTIGTYAFINAKKLSVINMPAVDSIGNYAFNGCTSLSSVNIAGTKEDYENMEISSTTNLDFLRADTNISNPQTGDVVYAGMSIYASWVYDKATKTLTINNCEGVAAKDMLNFPKEESIPWVEFIDEIETVVITGVSKIGSRTMFGSSSVKTLIVEEPVTAINSWAFYNASSLENVKIPVSLKVLGTGSFYGNSIKQIELNGTMEDYESITFGKTTEAFQRATFLLTDSTKGWHSSGVEWNITDNVLTITGDGTMASKNSASNQPWYAYKDSVTEIVVSEGIKNIGKYAFSEFSKVKEITIPSSVTKIDACAFDDMANLETITITTSLTSVGTYAFRDCPNLKTVNYNGKKAQFNEITIGSGNNQFKKANIVTDENTYLGKGVIGTTINWNLTDLGVLTVTGTGKIPNYSSSVRAPWYDLRESITVVTIGEGITVLGNQSFANATNLNTLNLPATVTSIGNYATYKTNLKTVNYNSNAEMYALITVGSNNTPLTRAKVNYIE